MERECVYLQDRVTGRDKTGIGLFTLTGFEQNIYGHGRWERVNYWEYLGTHGKGKTGRV